MREFDNYMRNKSQVFMFGRHQINPPSDFAEKIFLKIEKIESKRKFMLNVFMVTLIFIPFMFIELWKFARHDYFSISGMPFSQIITNTYTFFLSSLATYLLLTIGIIGTAIYLLGNRLFSKLRIITNQIFGLARYRI